MSDRFAVRHKVGDDYFYGWFRAYITPIQNQYSWPWVALDQMAYCTIPNYPLVWGQTYIVSIDENDESTPFATLYPNPTNDELTVKGPEILELTLYDLLGQKMLTKLANGEMEVRMKVDGLPQALYLLEVRTKKGNKTRLVSVIK